MEGYNNFSLNDDEIGYLKDLISIPSDTNEGEIEKINTIENLLQGANLRLLHRIPVGDGRDVLVAEKGSGKHAFFTLMFYAHVDTVGGHPHWPEQYTCTEKNGKIYGRGVWDMQSSVMQMISLAHSAKVSQGMNVLFAFCPDEERNSAGVEALLKWERTREVDLVCSSEIGPLHSRQPGKPFRYIASRMGAFKAHAKINLLSKSHGSLANASDAMEERDAAMGIVRRIFKETAREHELFENGESIHGVWCDAPQLDFCETRMQVPFGYTLKNVPTNENRTLQDILDEQLACFQRINEVRKWEERGISCTLNTSINQTSYLPYDVHIKDYRVRVVVDAIKQVLHKGIRRTMNPQPAGGPSQADQNKFVEAGYACVDVPMDGDHSHDKGEWVRKRDIGRIREVFRYLIEQSFLGFIEQARKLHREKFGDSEPGENLQGCRM